MTHQWTPEDDKLMYNLTILYRLDWKKISTKFEQETGKRATPVFLSKRYKVIKPLQNYTKKAFGAEDDEKIEEYVKTYGDDWVRIGLEMGNYDPIKIRNRFYQKVKNSDLNIKNLKQIREEREALEKEGNI
mmetsp:Transcript_27460/g.24204  ORF Transcript_27460/g.24204 Transcript_27460/m.24204 type:complete len:131 (-) Transcript_27460:180-572(-)